MSVDSAKDDSATFDKVCELYDSWLRKQSQLVKLYEKACSQNNLKQSVKDFHRLIKCGDEQESITGLRDQLTKVQKQVRGAQNVL